MMEKNESIIRICQVRTKEDYQFVQSCLKEEQFDLYIHNTQTKCEEYKIFRIQNEYIGIFYENYINAFGVNMYSPNIFIKRRKYSMFCITSMITYICRNKGWEKIIFLVYSNNKQCLNIINRIGIHLEGVAVNTNYEKKIDTYVFSILPEEVETLKIRIRELLRL